LLAVPLPHSVFDVASVLFGKNQWQHELSVLLLWLSYI
jgi:hypothetical protein